MRFAHRMFEPAWDSNHIAVSRCSSAAPKPAGARAHIAGGRPEALDRAQWMLKQGEETAGRRSAWSSFVTAFALAVAPCRRPPFLDSALQAKSPASAGLFRRAGERTRTADPLFTRQQRRRKRKPGKRGLPGFASVSASSSPRPSTPSLRLSPPRRKTRSKSTSSALAGDGAGA